MKMRKIKEKESHQIVKEAYDPCLVEAIGQRTFFCVAGTYPNIESNEDYGILKNKKKGHVGVGEGVGWVGYGINFRVVLSFQKKKNFQSNLLIVFC